MGNENLFSNASNLSCEDLEKQSNLKDLIERTNNELSNLHQCILKAKSFKYPNDETARFAEKVLNKYSHSVLQIDSTSLSTKKSIWVYANDCVVLSSYEEQIKASAIALSHVDFSVWLEDYKEKIYDDMRDFIELSLKLINSAMDFKFSFYLESINLKKFEYDNALTVQLEVLINVR